MGDTGGMLGVRMHGKHGSYAWGEDGKLGRYAWGEDDQPKSTQLISIST